MNKEISKEKASRLINCGELILVSCGFEFALTITPCAWHLPVSREPALMAVALAKKHYSSELIQKSKEFIIAIPHWQMLSHVMHCGKVSGRNIDKFKESGLTAQKSLHLLHARSVAQCIGHIELTLSATHEIGDHFLFIGAVVCAYAQDNYFINDSWDTSVCELIFHLGGKKFFKSSKPEEITTV